MANVALQWDQDFDGGKSCGYRSPSSRSDFVCPGTRLGFQDSGDSGDGVPIPRGCACAEESIDLAKAGNRPHVPAVHSENEAALGRNNPHQPFAIRRKSDWKRWPEATGFRQDAHEPNRVTP